MLDDFPAGVMGVEDTGLGAGSLLGCEHLLEPLMVLEKLLGPVLNPIRILTVAVAVLVFKMGCPVAGLHLVKDLGRVSPAGVLCEDLFFFDAGETILTLQTQQQFQCPEIGSDLPDLSRGRELL
jgi:hypothetical protein